MTDAQKLELIPAFQEVICEHNRLYYQEERPIISDYTYDQLFKKLREWEEVLLPEEERQTAKVQF